MMLDLNIGIISDDSSSWSDSKVLVMAVEEEEAELMGARGGGGKGREEEEEGEEQSSRTSDSSSVVNDDEFPVNAGDENSSRAAAAAASALVFDVFNKANEERARSELVTRQLFPVPGGGAAEHGPRPAAPAATLMTRWLDLSFAGGGGGESGGGQLLAGELRSFQPQKKQQARKSRRGPRSRSSQYRGVTFYRRTGRWESHIWDCGKQVYLGGFDTAYAAARAYDRAAIKFRGVDADINFSASDYEEDMRLMGNLAKEEFVHVLRRQSTGGFPRSSSKYRAMGLLKCGRWESRTGQFLGKKGDEDLVARPRAVTGLGYDLGTVSEATGQVSVGTGGHNLDLNLGMAPPSAGDSVKIEAAGCYHGQGSRTVDSPKNISAPKKLIPVWPATYHFLLPNSEGKAVGRRRAEVPASPNFGGQIANNGNYGGTSASPATMPRVLSDNAASSGFSSSCSSSNSFYHFK